jgi:hypothetical protein
MQKVNKYSFGYMSAVDLWTVFVLKNPWRSMYSAIYKLPGPSQTRFRGWIVGSYRESLRCGGVFPEISLENPIGKICGLFELPDTLLSAVYFAVTYAFAPA